MTNNGIECLFRSLLFICSPFLMGDFWTGFFMNLEISKISNHNHLKMIHLDIRETY